MDGPLDGSIEDDLSSAPSIRTASRVLTDSDRALLRIEIAPDSTGFFEFLLTENIRILETIGDDHGWEFKLEFPSSNELQSFRQYCETAGIEFTVDRLYHPHADDYGPDFGLTPQQREALLLAVDEDYFTVPRGATTTDIGDRIGISDQAVSERLRRAVNTLVSNTLDTQDQPSVDQVQSGGTSKSE
ncbi:MAG: helix-turn-helix domain-containing protein [Halobacteriales archaeon]